MFIIGDFAKLGRVSVRMLRLRRAQLTAQMAADAVRLTGVEARLRMIEEEGRMNTDDVVVKEIPSVRVAKLSAVAASYEGEDIGPVIGPLYQDLFRRLEAAGLAPCGPTIAYYDPAPDSGSEAVTVHAAVMVAEDARPPGDLAVLDLTPIPDGRDHRPPWIDGRGRPQHARAGPVDRGQRLPDARVRAGGLPGVRAGPAGQAGSRVPGRNRTPLASVRGFGE
jgi:hypothetical protein